MKIKISECCKAPMILLWGTNEKICCKCTKAYPWDLKKGVKSVLTNNVGGKNEK